MSEIKLPEVISKARNLDGQFNRWYGPGDERPDLCKVRSDLISLLFVHLHTLLDAAEAGSDHAAREAELRKLLAKQDEEICHILGKALSFPWFKDDQKNFPGATEEDGVCVGDQVAETMAECAAKKIVDQRAVIERLEGLLAQSKRHVTTKVWSHQKSRWLNHPLVAEIESAIQAAKGTR